MKMKYVLIYVTGLLIAMCCGESADSAAKKKAIKEAAHWLANIDNGEYVNAWRQADPLIQEAVDEKVFVKQLETDRAPLGKVISRTLKGASHHTSLPDVPDGQYVVIKFDTKLEKKKNAVETITPKLGDDGKWRVSEYNIK